MALLDNGISTIGFPCNDVYNRTVHTYIHTYVRSVSSPDSFTAPIKNAPTYSYTSFFFFFSSKQSTNVSQASSENKAIRKPVLALEQSTRKKKKKKKKKHLKSSSPKSSSEEKKEVASSLLVVFSFSSHCPVFSSKMLCCQAIKRTHDPLSLAYCSEIYTKNVHT